MAPATAAMAETPQTAGASGGEHGGKTAVDSRKRPVR